MGFEEYEAKGDTGPRLEVKKHVRAEDGWPYQFEKKWFQQAVDCAKHTAPQGGTEIFGGPR